MAGANPQRAQTVPGDGTGPPRPQQVLKRGVGQVLVAVAIGRWESIGSSPERSVLACGRSDDGPETAQSTAARSSTR